MNSKDTTQDLVRLLRRNLPFEPTADQQGFLEKFAHFLTDDERFRIFLLKGYAGTGKTTMVRSLVKTLPSAGWKTVLLAPTGRAAKVISAYSGHQANTIHRKIYLPVTRGGYTSFELSPNKHTRTLFIIDEASMIGTDSASGSDSSYRDLLEDTLRYIYRGKECLCLFIGDTAQLPPVGMEESPALDPEYIRFNFRLQVHLAELKEVVRQAEDSGILYNATLLRYLQLTAPNDPPQFQIGGFQDVKRINGNELQDELEWAYSNYGEEGVRVITRSNKRAYLFNQQIRSRIYYVESELQAGDLLMVVRNNYYWIPQDNPDLQFLANGEYLQVRRIRRTEEIYGMRFIEGEFALMDIPGEPVIEAKIFLDSLSVEGPHLEQERIKLLFETILEDYADEPDPRKRKEKVLKDPYYNALQVKYGYAVTCHKAQGGQWPVVFIDQGYVMEDMMDLSFLRWMYTAFTRATDRLYLVNFNEEFFSVNDRTG